MEKINVDIKYGKFVEYPGNRVFPFLEGILSKTYFRSVGYTKQFKIVLLTEHSEITLNVITTSIDFEIIVNSLIFRTSNKIKLELIENGNYTNLKLT